MNSTHKLNWWPRKAVQRVFCTLLMVLMVIAGTATLVLASDVEDALWRGTVTISNNGTTASAVSVNMSLNSASLVSNGYASADLTDIAMQVNGVDTAFMPSANASYPWVIFVPNIGASQNLNYDLYTGGATGGKIAYFPGDGGMTADSFQLGDNFTVGQAGWVDTGNGTDKNLIYKEFAFKTYISGSGNITSAILGGTENFSNYTEEDTNNKLTVTATKATGADVDTDEDVYLYDDKGIGSFNALNIDFEIYIANTSLPGGRGGMAVTNTVNDMTGFAATDVSAYAWRFGTDYKLRLVRGQAVAFDLYAGAANTLYYCTLSRATGDDSVSLLIYSDAVRATLLDTLTVTGFGTVKWRYLYGFVNRNDGGGGEDFDGYVQNMRSDVDVVSVTAPLVSSGNHTVTVWADTSDLHIAIDTVESDNTNLGGVFVPNNDNGWSYVTNGAMAYMEYTKITIDGVPQQHIAWEYDTTFTDLSTKGHDATPTFRTARSDADVSAELSRFEPVDEAKLDTFLLVSSTEILTANATLPSEMYSEFDVSRIPGGEAVNEMLAEGGVPQAAWWFPFLYLGICVAGLTMYGATTLGRTGMGGRLAEGQIDGSLLVMFIVMEVPLALLGIMGVTPFWPAILFPIAGIALILSRKHYSWG